MGQTTYNYTGGIQTYTVPAGVTSITVDAKGAKGGGVNCSYGAANYQSDGGCGGRVQCTVAVTPGQVLNIVVGGAGSSTSGVGGYGGGGRDNSFTVVWPGAGGGGGTTINDNATGTTLVVAGGGGGGGGDFCPGAGYGTGLGDIGGAGGGLTGGIGRSNICGLTSGGKGGTQVAGGAGGVCSIYTGTTGALGTGASYSGTYGSGGGGGGYYGGGSGSYGSGGGGGSSYTNPTYVTGVTHTQGSNCNNGQVIIDIACLPPASIMGTPTVCYGNTTTLSNTTLGGTWTSSAPGVASVSSTGVVTGMASAGGTAIISYTVAGCSATVAVTVNPLPAGISGPATVCTGHTATFADASGTGTWTSSIPTVATIGSTSGILAGIAGGTTTIAFTSTTTGCSITKIVTVNPSPGPISGMLLLCQGNSATLTDTVAGGTWTSSAGGTASITATGGVWTATGAGIATITYSIPPAACYATVQVTVNPTPPAITGSTTICVADSTPLTNTMVGGIWVSGTPGVATINSGTGEATGVLAGTSVITYMLPGTGCFTTRIETVNALPSPIVGTDSVCANAEATYSDTTIGGTWTILPPGLASVSTSGIVTGIASGTTVLTYSIATGCRTTKTITMTDYPAPILGDSTVCVGYTGTVTDATVPGHWTISTGGTTVDAVTGIVTSGTTAATPIITYTSDMNGCFVSRPFTVNMTPSPIAGITRVCDSSGTNLLDAMPGGTWYSTNPAIFSIDVLTGVGWGNAVGTDTVYYTISSTGCFISTTISVQPPPAPISGIATVCPLLTTTLTDAATGGFWTGGNTTIASIDSASGLVLGIAPGTVVLTYDLGICSTTRAVTVNALPGNILGTPHLCNNGATTTLFDDSTGGNWFSDNPAIAGISFSGGVVTAASVGTTHITYTLPTTGCFTLETFTVNPLPAPIAGFDTVCIGQTLNLSDVTTPGLFTSGNVTIASVTSATGVVTGISAGNVVITYTATSTGCQATRPVYAMAPITALVNISVSPKDTVCEGTMPTFTAATVNPGNAPTYNWTVNNIGTTPHTNPFTYSPADADVVRCVLVSNATCAIPNTVTSNPIKMTVEPVTNPVVTMTSTLGDTICTGATNTYSVVPTLGGATPQFFWTVNWMPVATGVTNYTYSPSNGDIVRCSMISSSQCPIPDTASATDTVVIVAYDTPKVNLTGAHACTNQPISISATTAAGGYSPLISWSLNGNPAGSGMYTLSYMPNDSDIVTCTMVSNYHCPVPSDTAKATFMVHVDPIIVVTVTAVPGMLVAAGHNDTLTANVQYGGLDPAYQWYVNGVIVPGATAKDFITNSLHNLDSVSCVVTTGSGSACEGIKGFNWLVVVVAPEGLIGVHPSNAGYTIAPNPNTGNFILRGYPTADEYPINIQITDVVGRKILSRTLEYTGGVTLSTEISLNPSLPPGQYHMRIAGKTTLQSTIFTITGMK